MIRIELRTLIAAPLERCFDLSRSIDLHVDSMRATGERAIAGVTAGLIGANEEVTWRTQFCGIPVTHKSRITAYNFPHYFQDSMVRGVFQSYCHDHYFEANTDGTLMKDFVEFSAPWGFPGRIAGWLVVGRHVRGLLERRSEFIKRAAEGSAWMKFLKA
jgi:ligand-binding SRPBCC domain-containing protein